MKFLRFVMTLIVVSALALCMAACADSSLGIPEITLDDENNLRWQAVDQARQYEVEIHSIATGENKTDQTRRTYYSLNSLEEGDYEIRVRALGGRENSLASPWSQPRGFHKDFESGLLYKLINQNTEYAIERAGTAEGIVTVEPTYRGKPVTAILENAFRASGRITQVIVKGNVRTVGEKAFYNCSALTAVELPDSVVSIGPAAFQICNKLEQVRLPEGLTAIPEYLFAYCRSLSGIEIPETVVTIGESAFYGCSALKEVEIPDSVTTVGPYAFAEATAVERLSLGSGLRTVGESAFYDDLLLSEIGFGTPRNSLTIGANAFAKCSALSSVELPEGLTGIGEQAFYQCSSLAKVGLPESLVDAGAFLFNGTALYAAQETEGDFPGFVYADDWLVATTPDVRATVRRLTPDSFREGVVGIASNVFIGCAALEQVQLPASVRYLCANSFYGNPVLNRFLAEDDSLVSIGEGAFRACEMLSNVQFGEGLLTIGSYAFDGCTQLRNSTFVDSLVPSTVTRIGTYAFRDTGLYNSPDEYGVIYAGNWVVGFSEPQSTVALKEDVVGIADYAFYRDDALELITGLNRVRQIGRGAFADCYSLAQISLSRNLRTIREYTFRNCTALFNVNFPLMLENIERYAFMGCSTLNTVDFSGTSLSYIGTGAFYGCSSMQSLLFSDALTEIADYAFYSCTNLTELRFPDSLETVGTRSFALCDGVTEIAFGGGLVSIGEFAFRGMTALSALSLPDSLREIGGYAFYGCSSLSVLNLGEGVEKIGKYAFAHAAITALSLPATVSEIGECAFKNCESLAYTFLPKEIGSIGKNAFYGCYLLTFYSDGASADMWDGRWNSSFCPIVWGCARGEDGTVVSVTAGDLSNPVGFFGIASPRREGYRFVGWAREPGAAEAEFQSNDLPSVPQGVVLYPVWEAENG